MSNYAYPHMRATEVNNSGPRSKCDQVIYEAIAKACEIVVSSRVTHASDAGSSRFNLHIPEISQVRSILQAWRLTLHVPIRLDVYYQHEGDRRELLERWCLEYKPASTEHFIQTEGVVTQDPIVQLRHVCKRIVLWLRTLYCWTRLLPAQTLNSKGIKSPIGFSMYVNTERKDDVTDLTQNQGFRWQKQPSSVVSPYGELEWKVIYSSSISRLVSIQRPTRSIAMSIPTSNNTPDRSEELDERQQMIRHSAPSHFATMRAKSFNSESYLAGGKNPIDQQHTYDSSCFVRPAQPSSTTAQLSPHGVLRRRHTSIGQETAPTVEMRNDQAPERILSGLSLAMMSLNQEDDDDDDDESFNVRSDEPEVPSDTVIRRHAALHQLPLHVLEQQQLSHHQPVPASREYGYGYNNHIAWQNIQPSISKPVVGRSYSDLSDNNNNYSRTPTYNSSFLGSTPPSAAFLGATPPTVSSFTRPSSTMMTPPFKARPMGFVHEPLNAAAFIPPQGVAATLSDAKPDLLQPQTSLDLLHYSPFQQQAQLTSLVSSFAALTDGTGFNSSLADRTLWSSGAPPRNHREEDDFYEEDIPFAVEEDTASALSHQSPGSSLMYASSAVASFAQKCTANQRLSIFESDGGDIATRSPSTENVADKLLEFHSFGASLQASQTSTGLVGGNSSSVVPLRT